MTRLEPIAPHPAAPPPVIQDALAAPGPPPRSGVPAATWSGLALIGGLLPLGLLALARAISLPPVPAWAGAATTLALAGVAGMATIAAVAAALRQGSAARFLDATATGSLAATAAAAATFGTPLPGLAVGTLVLAPLLLLASLLPRPRLGPGLPRGAASVAAFLAIEAALGAALVLQSVDPVPPVPGALLAGAVALLLAAAVAAYRRPLRMLAAVSAASTAAVLLVAAPGGIEPLAAVVGLVMAGVALPLSHRFDRASPMTPAPAPVQLPVAAFLPDPSLEAEAGELRRLGRELRATIEELSAARHTVELQRAEIERLGSVDALTGVAPRPAVLERLRIATAEARRYPHPFAVVLLDLDGMADLNRRHGRAVGDQVLREVALRLRIRTRIADAIGRIDGDAFLVILPHTDERGATVFADAMRRLTADRPIVTDAGELRVSLSVGVAIMRAELVLSDDQLLTAVQEALASAKAGGGNRIAFDRLHGFARPEGLSVPTEPEPSEPAEAPEAPREEAR